MMEWHSSQMSMIILDLSELIPENRPFRKINQMISFDFTLKIRAKSIHFQLGFFVNRSLILPYPIMP